ncbi:MAG: hypothetical protein HXS54_06010 [Theionarchaea archaeon]|nr:hypothetical protein [Theionarchaea archaeon]DBA34815.1 TPA_asm: hypothetical protein vir521_00021 [Caudoviricetes sp. vir521]
MILKCPVCQTKIELTVLCEPVFIECRKCNSILSIEEVGGYNGFKLVDTGYKMVAGMIATDHVDMIGYTFGSNEVLE